MRCEFPSTEQHSVHPAAPREAGTRLEMQLCSHIPSIPLRLPLGKSVCLLLPHLVANLFLHGGRFAMCRASLFATQS